VTLTKWTTLALLTAGALALVWTALRMLVMRGSALPSPAWPVIVVIALLAIGVVAAAWPIRQWNAGRRDRAINPLRAARTVALAKASSLTGALMTGVWGAFAIVTLPRLEFAAQPGRAVAVALAVLASLALLVAGVLAERWCRIPPEDDGSEGVRAPDGSVA
jgi:hypothetical protein